MALHNPTQIPVESPTIPHNLGIPARRESYSDRTTNTSQNEVVTTPGSPSSQADASKSKDDPEVTSAGDAEHPKPPVPWSSLVPFAATDTTDILHEDFGAETTDVVSPRPAASSARPTLSLAVATSLDAAEAEDDPFKLMGNNSKVAPGAAEAEDDPFKLMGSNSKVAPGAVDAQFEINEEQSYNVQ
jgi:hypothetical protein